MASLNDAQATITVQLRALAGQQGGPWVLDRMITFKDAAEKKTFGIEGGWFGQRATFSWFTQENHHHKKCWVALFDTWTHQDGTAANTVPGPSDMHYWAAVLITDNDGKKRLVLYEARPRVGRRPITLARIPQMEGFINFVLGKWSEVEVWYPGLDVMYDKKTVLEWMERMVGKGDRGLQGFDPEQEGFVKVDLPSD